ncbi:MAG TPA: YetF domain-containing protein [Tepidisphaeraceae bacterium]|jgi:uncharacterized membrane protein YcaP (DUF421 family)|nr:YetF domain-containing protein [Tepidisphaeraceae bacterium]
MDALRELYRPDLPIWSLIIRAAVVYLSVLLLLRVGGKRQIAQMGMSEFVALLLISNAVQNSMNGGDNSLVGGIILAVMLILMSWGFQYATFKSRKLEQLVQGRPTLLIHKGKILLNHLNRELLTVRELKMILRKQGIHDLAEVCEAILESDGFVSITKMSDVQPEIEMERNDYY